MIKLGCKENWQNVSHLVAKNYRFFLALTDIRSIVGFFNSYLFFFIFIILNKPLLMKYMTGNVEERYNRYKSYVTS